MKLGVAAIVGVAIASCNSDAPPPPPATTPAVASPRIPGPVANDTNVGSHDYVGPAVCADCHPSEHARWSASLHAVMNQRAETAGAIIGDFGGAVVRYAGGEARFDHDREGYAMTLTAGDRHVRYRVTRTIGRRGLQEYVGIEDGQRDEVRLPFGWWPRRGGWYPQPYFDPWLRDEASFDAYAPVREPWAERCPWCHSTYPFAQRIARSTAKQLGHGLEQLFTAAAMPSGNPERLAVAEQVSVGISCESCHLGARAHVAGAPIHLVPRGAIALAGAPAPSTFAAERRDPAIVNAVCAQCHSGPSPRLADGTALRNSSEALDLAASACTGLRCTDCHDPHRADSRADEARAVAVCTGCHQVLAEPATARAHAGPGHAAASCLDCHMPKIVMGIDRFVRTHRIASPTNPELLAAAAPNACNLCHLDRSIAWTAAALHDRYDVQLATEAWRGYGEPGTAVGEAWLASPTPAIRIMAAAAYARSPAGKLALPALVTALGDPLPYVRTWMTFAVEDLAGMHLGDADFDPRATPAVRAAQLERLRARFRHPTR